MIDQRSIDLFGDTDPKLRERFKAFHEANPHIYEAFVRKARAMRATGRKRYSAWTIINVIRWEHDLKTRGEVFKVNNDFIALYARLMIYWHPAFQNFFELRQMKATRQLSIEDARRQRA